MNITISWCVPWVLLLLTVVVTQPTNWRALGWILMLTSFAYQAELFTVLTLGATVVSIIAFAAVLIVRDNERSKAQIQRWAQGLPFMQSQCPQNTWGLATIQHRYVCVALWTVAQVRSTSRP